MNNEKIAFRKLDRLDIIIPVYNEGDNIIDVLTSLQKSVRTSHRILICYDHDNDSTLQAISQYPDLAALNLLLVRNVGQGVLDAIKSGITVSNAAAILVFPADDKFNAKIIDPMVLLFEDGREIVAASRFIPGGCMEGCPWLKSILVRTAAFLLYNFAHLPTHDPTSGFRLFSRRVFDQFTIESKQGWSFSLELLVKCHRLGWRVGEVPALWYERTKGKSRFRTLRWLPGYLKWFFYAFMPKIKGELHA